MKMQNMTADEMEKLFDEGDMRYLEYFDTTKGFHPENDQMKMSISLPTWMIQSLDDESRRLGVSRQSIVRMWLDEKLKDVISRKATA